MKIYIAAPWKDKANVPVIAAQLEADGHVITKKWWEVRDTAEGSDGAETILRQQGEDDMNGVVAADLVLVINSSKSEGKAVEQGIALTMSKPIVIVGKRGEHSANVFHYMRNYRWVESVEEAYKIIATINWLLDNAKR